MVREVKPFLNWVGSKRRQLVKLDPLFPKELKLGKVVRYVEPFLGGGSVFFHVVQRYDVKEFFISDINRDLILVYEVVRDKVNLLIEFLHSLEDKFLDLDFVGKKKMFCDIRDEFNSFGGNYESLNELDVVRRAGQMLFLNRTSMYGLFRVNSNGNFNTSFCWCKQRRYLFDFDRESFAADSFPLGGE